MDSFLFEQFAPVPQMIPQSRYEVPSFEEAFDTNSLKNFYRNQSSPNHFEAKFRRDFGLDDDFQTHNFEAISPATTAQSQSFIDFFQPHYEDMRQDNSPRAALNLRDHLSPVQYEQNQVAKGIRFNENQGMMKRQESQVSQSDPNNMIAVLCEQMKQYYDQPQQETINTRPQVVKGEAELFFAKRFMSLDRETSVSFSDSSANRLEETVLRKLIFKKKIFTIQRDQKNNLKAKRKNSEANSLKLKKRAQSVHLPASLFNDETGLVGKMLVEEEKKIPKIRRKHSEAVGKEAKEAKAPRKKSEKLEKKEKKEKKEKTPKISPQQSESVQNTFFGSFTLN